MAQDSSNKSTPAAGLPDERQLERITDFFHEAGHLRHTPRSGYAFLGSGSENVAEHSYRTSVIGYTLAKLAGADAARVTGPDLMRELLEESGKKHYRHYFYGSTQETLDILREKITEKYPGAVIAGMYSPPFRPLTADEDTEIVEKINAAKPDFVWVGLGAPKQERWMAAHENRVQALMLGVGAAFDYEAGNIRRAPAWMQRCNLEWLYRLMQDPKRLFKRYFVTNTKFLWWSWRH